MICRRSFLTAVAVTAIFVAGAVVPSGAKAGRHYRRACGPPTVHYCNAPCVCVGAPVLKQEIAVSHPCTGVKIAVPVCLPTCCTGAPTVCGRGTLFGCGLTRYTWCCGHSVTIRFTKCGDVKVIYR